MILKYVLKNFTRRKVRTILMILSLLVSTGLIVAMNATVETVRRSNVDLIAIAVGRYDLAISKTEISPDPFLNVTAVSNQILAANEEITAVYPRFHIPIEMNVGGDLSNGTLVALDPAVDEIGFVDVIEGDYVLGDGQTAVFEETATLYDLQIGDTINVGYSYPQPREEGRETAVNVSQRRINQQFTVSGIVHQDGVLGAEARAGLIIHLDDAQSWLGMPDRAPLLIATIDPALYETNNAELAALRVRDVVEDIQIALGDEYLYAMEKAAVLSAAAQGFLVMQALINTYGLMSLGVVGLLVYTLVMTNVQEQRRDMAILRILGGQRRFLFTLVMAEVLVIGAIGIFFGIGLGQLITKYIIVPLISAQMLEAGITSPLTPQVTATAIIPAVVAAFTVLIISSLKPAQDASRTKVMHAINPGVADNIQIEDLAKLRERRPDFKMFLAGLGLMAIFALIAGFQVVETFGGPALEAIFILLALGLLVLGLGLMFFIATVPFERLTLLLMGLIAPRLTYFARRNVGRGQSRNTLISLLVLFSGVLPSFLATQMAMENVNFEGTIRADTGAPIKIVNFGDRLEPSFLDEELAAIAALENAVGLSYGYGSRASDTIGFRDAPINVIGVDGDLGDVLFADLIEFTAGDVTALTEIGLANAASSSTGSDYAVVISDGLAEQLSLTLGDTLHLRGEGIDHMMPMQIVGIAARLPGFDDIKRGRNIAQGGSDVLLSLPAFRLLTTALHDPIPLANAPILTNILATVAADADQEAIADEIGKQFRESYSFWTRVVDVEVERNRRAQASQQTFLLVLTAISFTTAVFGVFAVIYVSIYARRLEIGMMKAMGMRRRQLTGMLIIEAITMTLGAALAGIAAGAAMGYISFYSDRMLSQRPSIFTVDTTVIPFIVITVTLASILGAGFSARRIVKKSAVEILRM